MKTTDIPDYRKRQHLLYTGRASEKEMIAYGDRYREAEMIADAVECYQAAHHTAGLEQIRDLAEATGDVMVYLQVLKALNRTATPEDWDKIGRQALALKKYAFSLRAFEQSENHSMIEEIKRIVSGLKEDIA